MGPLLRIYMSSCVIKQSLSKVCFTENEELLFGEWNKVEKNQDYFLLCVLSISYCLF